jgi:hypothetical protein
MGIETLERIVLKGLPRRLEYLLRLAEKCLLATDIEQVLKEKKPFILRCMPGRIKRLQGRVDKWNRFASNASIT